MVAISNLFLFILYLIQSTHQFVKVTVPYTTNPLYPLVFNYEGQRILLTSQGNYNITYSSGSLPLETAENIFDSRFYVDNAIDKVYRLYDSQNQVYYFFPNINGKIYVKYPSQEPIGIEHYQSNYRITSGIYGTSLGFVTESKYRVQDSYVYWDGTISAFDLENGTKLMDCSLSYNGDKQEIFSCRYIEIYDGIYCFYSTSSGDVYYRTFNPDVSSYSFSGSNLVLSFGKNIGGLKFDNIENTFYAVIWFDSTSTILPSIINMSKDYPMGGYSMFSNLICADVNNMEFVLLKEIKMSIVCCFNGETTECEFFDENIIPLDISNFKKVELTQLRVSLEYINNEPILSFVGTDPLNSSLIYYMESTIFECKDLEFDVIAGMDLTINIWDLVSPNPLEWNDESGLYIYFARTTYGNITEIDENDNSIGEVIFGNVDHLYQRLKYTPTSVGKTMLSYRGFVKVFGNFYLPTKTCSISFQTQCYQTCETCSFIGNDESHMCDTCKTGHFLKEGTNDCYNSRPSTYFLDYSTLTFRKCPLNCEYCENTNECLVCVTNYELLSEFTNVVEDKTCIKNCLTEHFKWYINETNGTRNVVCLDGDIRDCPKSHNCLNQKTNECLKWEENNTLCNHSIPTEGNESTIVDYLVEDIVGYHNESFIHVQENKTIIVYDTTQTSNDKFNNENLTTVELGECEQKLKEVNNIPSSEKLLIAQIDNANPEHPVVSLSLLVFSENGTLLNISACVDIKIVVVLHSANKPSELISKQQLEMYQTDHINVFDSQDDFFNDRCKKYSTLKDGQMKDVSLQDRRKHFYSNVSLCDETHCELGSTNDEKGQIDCICSVGQNDSSKEGMLSFTSSSGEKPTLWKSISFINIDILFCPHLVFNKEILLKNIGFFIMSVLLFLQILNYVFYFCIKENIFSKFIFNDSNNDIKWNPPIKEGQNEEKQQKQEDNTPHIRPSDIKLIPFSTTGSPDKKYFLEKYTWNKSDEISIESKSKSQHNKILDIIPLNQAVTYDKRSFCGLYIFRLKRSHLLYLMIKHKKDYYFRNITISLFIFQISSNFFLNALFYTDYYVSLDYNLGYNVIQEIPKSCYTMLIGLGLNIICGIFGKRELKLPKILKGGFYFNNKEKNVYIKESKFVRYFHTIYFIIIFILSVFYWYYVSSFCAVYQYSQINWLIGAVISIGLSLIFPFIICLISVFFRRKSIEIRNERMFHFSKVVEAMH